jgi:hypothetical protein
MPDTLISPAIPAPTPNTGATNAPDVPASGGSSDDSQDIIATITQNAIKETLAQQAEPETGRDDKGRFVAKPKEEVQPVVEGEAAPVVEGEPVAEPKEEIVLPEGMAAVKKIDRELATPFKVLDEAGELQVPDVLIEFEANGKTRKEPIDKVVMLAKAGVYNHERFQALVAREEQARVKETQLQQVELSARELQQERKRLLSDPDYLVSELQKYERENTPEAVLQREREQVASDRQKLQYAEWDAKGERFVNDELIPAAETIIKALPTVTEYELREQLALIQDRYKVQTPFGAFVPPENYHLVSKAIASEVVPWAKQVHAERDYDRQQAISAAKKEAEQAKANEKQAQVKSQEAKNLIGRTVKPGTRSQPHGTSTRQPKPDTVPESIEDREAFVLRKALEGMA